jgi:uncharacterized protein
MLLLDANPLLYALREDAPDHSEWRGWLEELINGEAPFAVCSFTLTAVLRIATSTRIFKVATPLGDVLQFIDGIRESPVCVPLEPGPQHWNLVNRLVRAVRAGGNVASDAYLAALALEGDAKLITADHDFARFPTLRFSNPLARR